MRVLHCNSCAAEPHTDSPPVPCTTHCSFRFEQSFQLNNHSRTTRVRAFVIASPQVVIVAYHLILTLKEMVHIPSTSPSRIHNVNSTRSFELSFPPTNVSWVSHCLLERGCWPVEEGVHPLASRQWSHLSVLKRACTGEREPAGRGKDWLEHVSVLLLQ